MAAAFVFAPAASILRLFMAKAAAYQERYRSGPAS